MMSGDKRPLLYVEWWDHAADGGWSDINDTNPLHLCLSIGWLLKEYRDRLVLFSSLSPGHVGNTQIIAKKLIKTKRTLKPK